MTAVSFALPHAQESIAAALSQLSMGQSAILWFVDVLEPEKTDLLSTLEGIEVHSFCAQSEKPYSAIQSLVEGLVAKGAPGHLSKRDWRAMLRAFPGGGEHSLEFRGDLAEQRLRFFKGLGQIVHSSRTSSPKVLFVEAQGQLDCDSLAAFCYLAKEEGTLLMIFTGQTVSSEQQELMQRTDLEVQVFAKDPGMETPPKLSPWPTGRSLAWGIAEGQRLAFYAYLQGAKDAMSEARVGSLSSRDAQKHVGTALGLLGEHASALQVYQKLSRDLRGISKSLVIQRQADHLLKSGDIEGGLSTAMQTLGNMGVRTSESTSGAALNIIGAKGRLMFRGLKFKPRSSQSVDAEKLALLDSYWALGLPLITTEPLIGQQIMGEYIRLALEVGEPGRVARALAFEAAGKALMGSDEGKVERLFQQAQDLAKPLPEQHFLGGVFVCKAIAKTTIGGFREAEALCDEAERRLLQDPYSADHGVAACRTFRQIAMFWGGNWSGLAENFGDYRSLYKDKPDAFGSVIINTNFGWFFKLIDDDVPGAMAIVDASEKQWRQGGFHPQHMVCLLARMNILLYEGRGDKALALIEETRAGVDNSGLLRFASYRARYLGTVIRAKLRFLEDEGGPVPAKVLKNLERQIKSLSGKRGWISAIAAMFNGRLLGLRGNHRAAIEQMLKAEDILRPLNMDGVIYGLKYRRSCCMSGPQAQTLKDEAFDAFSSRKAKNPRRMIDLFT